MLNKSLGPAEAIRIKAIKHPKAEKISIHHEAGNRVSRTGVRGETVKGDDEVPQRLYISRASIPDAPDHGEEVRMWKGILYLYINLRLKTSASAIRGYRQWILRSTEKGRGFSWAQQLD